MSEIKSEIPRPDIFDRMMRLPLLRIFQPFYAAHKEVLLYLFFGGLAFFLNLFLFMGIARLFGLNELVNNVICWILCVLLQFFTNRTWVFAGAKETEASGFFRQMAQFFGGRIFTLLVEEAILAVFITWLGLNAVAVKLAAQVVVIVLNYIISKVWVFKEQA